MNGRALLARNLRRLRTARGISQERLAADSNVDRAYISEIEREQGNATIDLLDRLASVIGIRIGEFFEEPASEDTVPLRRGRKPRVS